MAHEFLGTFNKAMFDRLRTFVQSQEPFIDARILHLEAERVRVGSVIFRYNKGVPIGYTADPVESYLGKLLAVYEVLGGNPFVDLRVRLLTDPVFILPGDENVGPHTMSNGEVIGAKGLNDTDSAELIRQFRTTFNPTLQRRFDYLERKIRRAVDYVDQIGSEIAQLHTLKTTAVGGSLEDLVSQVNQLLSDPTYRAITPDTSENAKFGFDIHAPFSSYDIPEGPLQDPSVSTDREAVMPQRQSGAKPPVKPGQRSI